MNGREEIKKFLDDNGVEYSTELGNFCLFYGNPGGKRSYEIEYVESKDYPVAYPKYNIEGVSKSYFFDLSYEAEMNNSFKLWIKDFEWNDPNKKEVLKSYILHAAGKTPHSFYARDCIVSEVPTKEARAFEEVNCFYGKRGASLNLGLYLKKEKNGLPKNTLLMIYTFGKNFFGKDDSIIEVIRVGTLRYSNVVGGSSKLLKHFIRNYRTMKIGKNIINVKFLKFYSDYDHNIGGSMEKLDFEFQGYSNGGFMNYWVKEGKAKQRQPMMHKEIMEKMKDGEVLSIPNAGVKVFILTLPDNDEKVDNTDLWFK